MSLRVWVFPEDATYNGSILRPLIARLLEECGRPNAKVEFPSQSPPFGEAAAKRKIRERMSLPGGKNHLWILILDQDGKDRHDEFEVLLAEAKNNGIALACCAAKPELEAWLLAGHTQNLDVPWPEIRSHSRLKEEVFEPFLKKFGDESLSDGGRARLMQETLRQYRGLIARCPEIKLLQEDLLALIRSQTP